MLADGRPSGPFGHGYTYTAHPVAAAAALANLDIIEREGLVERAGQRGACMQRLLREAFTDHPLVGEVRGIGADRRASSSSPRRIPRRRSIPRSRSARA